MQPLFHSEDILEIPAFLTPAECAELLTRSEALGYAEAGVSLPEGPQLIKGIRNNYRLEYPDAALAAQLWPRLRDLLPPEPDDARPAGLYEHFRFYRYDVGERFNKHRDGHVQAGEMRSRWTLLLYLNDDFAGGATEFEALTITPRRGTALCFRHALRHRGCPVEQGRKYVLRTDVLYHPAPTR